MPPMVKAMTGEWLTSTEPERLKLAGPVRAYCTVFSVSPPGTWSVRPISPPEPFDGAPEQPASNANATHSNALRFDETISCASRIGAAPWTRRASGVERRLRDAIHIGPRSDGPGAARD